MEANELIAELGKKIGIDLKFDAYNSCGIEADGMAVLINYLEEIGLISITADIGEPPPERLEGLYKVLLEGNHMFAATAGSTISLDPETGHVTLCRAVPCKALGPAEFNGEIERFVNTLEMWKKTVEGFRAAPPVAETSEAGNPAFGTTGFMQV